MTTLTRADMAALLQEIAASMVKLNEFWGLQNKVRLHPPASPGDIERIQRSCKVPLPPSYLQLLSIHDGIDDFYGVQGELLRSNFRSRFPGFDAEWRRPGMWVFVADEDWNAVAFDLSSAGVDGEMQVVEIAENVDADRWPSLSDFLSGYRDRLAGWLAKETADRRTRDDD